MNRSRPKALFLRTTEETRRRLKEAAAEAGLSLNLFYVAVLEAIADKSAAAKSQSAAAPATATEGA